MDSAQGRDLVPIFGDLSQSEKLSEIKPPLNYCDRFRRTWFVFSLHTSLVSAGNWETFSQNKLRQLLQQNT